MKKILSICLLMFIYFGTAAQQFAPEEWVNVLMGSDSKRSFSTGNTYPAIAVPWGMNFWTPQTGPNADGWQYQYASNRIRGFKQTHQPSPWIGDYGQFSVMPMTGKLRINEESRGSIFSHKTEIAKPYYYGVYLADDNVFAEMTPTERACIMQFTFPSTDSAFVLVDAYDKGSSIQIIPEQKKIIGYTTRNRGGVPENFKNYFVLEFDKPFEISKVINDKLNRVDSLQFTGNHAQCYVQFKTKKDEVVHVKISSSFISPEQAQLNLRREIGNASFQKICNAAKSSWHKELSKLRAEGGTEDQMKTFYSCLYRMLLFPRKLYELDANNKMIHYSPYNGKIMDGLMFTDTGFWDTFRALFPFLSLMFPEMDAQIMQGLTNAYKEGGWLPEWASPGYKNSMIGNNSTSVVSDAILKGIKGFDVNTLYEAMKKSAEHEGPMRAIGRNGAEDYINLGYVPHDKFGGSAAKTLEYAYADFCLSQVAKKLNRPQTEIDTFAKRSMYYKNIFDPAHKLMRGKNSNGSWDPKFNPFAWGYEFVEGNSWHYSWSVFHDFAGLSHLMGGNNVLEKMLDSVFVLPPVFDTSYYRYTIHEMAEMQVMNMGQYAHGNQPIQHMLYIYNYCGAPWKSQFHVREALKKLYLPTPDGYCGDEDNGQTSAWYVFSAMGFYPVCPGSNQYVFGSPLFKKMTLQLANGKNFVINAANQDDNHVYIQDAMLNGAKHEKNFINHNDIIKGGRLDFRMSAQPNLSRGIQKSSYPYSYSTK